MKKLRDNLGLKSRWYYLAGFLFFLAAQWYGIWYLWYGHPGPVGLDDAASYMSNIEFFRGLPFSSGGYESLSNPAYFCVNKVTYPLFYGAVARILGISSGAVFHLSFYVGLMLMGGVLYHLLRKIDSSPWFVVTAFALLAFYEGKGSYHGFSWVVPSFYALALFLTAIIAFFYSRRPLICGLPIILLLLLTHSTGIYLVSIVLLSYILNESVGKRNFRPLMAVAVLTSVVIMVVVGAEYLYRQHLIPGSFSSSFKSYYQSDLSAAADWKERLSIALQEMYITVKRHDFAKYYYGIYTPLVVYGLFQLVRHRKLPLVWVFGSLFAGAILTSTLVKYAYRFFYPLEVITWIVMAYGIGMILKKMFAAGIESPEIAKSGLPKRIKGFAEWGLLAIALLFFYNAVHQKAHHTTYVKYSNTRFFDKARFLDYMKQNPEQRFVVCSKLPSVYLSYDGMWQNPQLLFFGNTEADSVLASPGRFIIIGENHRYFDNGRSGVHVCVPHGCSLAVSAGVLKPGRYRLELIDSGIAGTEGLLLAAGSRRASGWKFSDADVHYPEAGMKPPIVMPWYWALDKTWPLFRRPIRANDVVRVSKKFQVDFTADKPLNTLTLVNNGDDLSLTGIIRIVDLDRGESREFDLDWGDEQMLKNDLGLIHEGRRLPLLWSGAYPDMMMTLEKNFRDVKAFSVYSQGWPVR